MPEQAVKGVVLVTGADGFVGRALCPYLRRSGYVVRGALRREGNAQSLFDVETVVVGEIGPETDWSQALRGVDLVVHLAARVHRMKEGPADSQAYHQVNALGSISLAEQAARAGVRRLVYLSSAKVYGEGGERPYTETDRTEPHGPYASSKWEAEMGVREVAAETALEAVVLRPPLVYGPEVRGNFLSLLHWVHRGIPLPLGRVKNRRSLLYLGNLVAAIETVLMHPAAGGRTFSLCDTKDFSTSELLHTVAESMGRPTRFFPLPTSLLKWLGGVVGEGGAVDRLLGSFLLDDALARNVLDWTPPYSAQEGVAATVNWYLGQRK